MSARAEVTHIPTALVKIAFDAAIHIDAFAKVLGEFDSMSAEMSAEREVVMNEMARRIVELNCVVLTVLTDNLSPAEASKLYRQVHREPMPKPEEECVD